MPTRINLRASRTPTPASEYRRPGSMERMVASNGEINASSRADAWQQSAHLIRATTAGAVTSDSEVLEAQAFQQRNRELIKAAFNDANAHRVLGQRYVDSLYQTANRQGFARRILAYQDLQQGQTPSVRVSRKNTTAAIASSPTRVETQIVRDKHINYDEVDITSRLYVSRRDLDQSTGDVLAEKFNEGLESLMVREDRLLIQAARQLSGIDNELSVISSSLTPMTFAQVQEQVTRWGLAVPYVLIASDIRTDIIGNTEFHHAMDPVTKYELIKEGMIGYLYGSAIISDAYRHREHQVLNRGEFFIFADKENLGVYSDRGGYESSPIDITTENIPGRGWVITEAYSMALANATAVAQGIRV